MSNIVSLLASWDAEENIFHSIGGGEMITLRLALLGINIMWLTAPVDISRPFAGWMDALTGGVIIYFSLCVIYDYRV